MGSYSDRLKDRIVLRGPKTGYCSICGSFGNLTEDHVPPKSCGNVNDVIVRNFYPKYDVEKYTSSQGGLRFKTICSGCNNTLLGTEYDIALASVVDMITSDVRNNSFVKSGYPPFLYYDFQPNRFARSVVGHLLAASEADSVDSRNKMPFDVELADYFLNPNLMLPSRPLKNPQILPQPISK